MILERYKRETPHELEHVKLRVIRAKVATEVYASKL
jgi:hypothetical protein